MKNAARITNDLYLRKITQMNRFELLEEISNFQYETKVMMHLSLAKLVQGMILFEYLSTFALSSELREVAALQKAEYEAIVEARLKATASLSENLLLDQHN